MSSSTNFRIPSESNITISPFFAIPATGSVPSSPNDDRTRSGASINASTNPHDAHGDSSLFGAGFNFVNSIVGAGIIGMPVAMKECGFFTGIFLILFVAYLVHQSTIMIIECGLVTKKLNLEELCRHLFGVHGYNACALSMFLFAYGAMIAYMMIIGDTVPIALDYFMHAHAPSRAVVMLVSGCLVMLPLSLLRDMSSLSSTSLLSISADFFMVLFICIRSQTAARNQGTTFDSGGDVTVVNGNSIAAGLGTISFAFVCQHSSFIVFRSMREATLPNWKTVANYSLVIAGSMCLLLALVGYLAFGNYVNGDILTNFSEQDELILVARLLLAITMIFTFPMEVFVARHCLISIVHNYLEEKNTDHVKHRSGGGANNANASIARGGSVIDTGRLSDMNGVELSSFGSHQNNNNRKGVIINVAVTDDEDEDEHEDDVEGALGAVQSSDSVLPNDSDVVDAESGSGDATAGSGSIAASSCSETDGPYAAEAVAVAEAVAIGRTDQEGDEHEVSAIKHVGVTLLLWGSSIIIAISTKNLKIVLALTGALAASMLGYIIPASLYLKTYESEFLAFLQKFDRESTSYEALPYQRVMSGSKFMLPLFMFAFGVIAMLTGVGTVFYEMSH